MGRAKAGSLFSEARAYKGVIEGFWVKGLGFRA